MFTVLLSDHFLHVSVLIIIYSFTEQNDCGCGLSLEPRLSIPDFVWNGKPWFKASVDCAGYVVVSFPEHNFVFQFQLVHGLGARLVYTHAD